MIISDKEKKMIISDKVKPFNPKIEWFVFSDNPTQEEIEKSKLNDKFLIVCSEDKDQIEKFKKEFGHNYNLFFCLVDKKISSYEDFFFRNIVKEPTYDEYLKTKTNNGENIVGATSKNNYENNTKSK